MANINIRKPRFYVDIINFLDSRDPAGGHYGISTSTNQIDVVSGNSVSNLFDMKPLNQVEFNTTGDPDGAVNLWFDLKTAAFNVDFVAINPETKDVRLVEVKTMSFRSKSANWKPGTMINRQLSPVQKNLGVELVYYNIHTGELKCQKKL